MTSYESLNTYSERYVINDTLYLVKADFIKDKIWISSNTWKEEYSLNEYDEFIGNMKDFAKDKIG